MIQMCLVYSVFLRYIVIEKSNCRLFQDAIHNSIKMYLIKKQNNINIQIQNIFQARDWHVLGPKQWDLADWGLADWGQADWGQANLVLSGSGPSSIKAQQDQGVAGPGPVRIGAWEIQGLKGSAYSRNGAWKARA